MPRCLMAKKWKAYPWTDRPETSKENRPENHRENAILEEDAEEEIDVVNDTPSHETPLTSSPKPMMTSSNFVNEEGGVIHCFQGGVIQVPPESVIQAPADQIVRLNHGSTPCSWGPSSPTEGATAPSPPPTSPSGSTILYNGYLHNDLPTSSFTTFVTSTGNDPSTQTVPQISYNNNPSPSSEPHQNKGFTLSLPLRKKSICLTTSTGTVLSLPPKKKDIYRPYSLDDTRGVSPSPLLPFQHTIRVPAEEDLHAAHAILDLSASTTVFMPPNSHQVILETHNHDNVLQEQENIRPQQPNNSGKTIAYTYEAFFVSDGRSKKRPVNVEDSTVVALSPKIHNDKPKYTCSECGKQYATSSNLSRHKQTHRSLDSQAAKKCMTCGKAYVSMPALAMHVLTHKLAHRCNVCGKQFSRPWLLQGHTRSHTGEKPYGCAHCGKAFADRSNLRAHMQTHSADKNFECSRCHKTFALKSYLNKHLESACLKEETPLDMLPNDLNVSLSEKMPNIRMYAG